MEYLEQFLNRYLTSEEMIGIQNYCTKNNIQVDFNFNDNVIAGSIRTLNKSFNIDTKLNYTLDNKTDINLKEIYKVSYYLSSPQLYYLDEIFLTYNDALNYIKNNFNKYFDDPVHYQIQKFYTKL